MLLKKPQSSVRLSKRSKWWSKSMDKTVLFEKVLALEQSTAATTYQHFCQELLCADGWGKAD